MRADLGLGPLQLLLSGPGSMQHNSLLGWVHSSFLEFKASFSKLIGNSCSGQKASRKDLLAAIWHNRVHASIRNACAYACIHLYICLCTYLLNLLMHMYTFRCPDVPVYAFISSGIRTLAYTIPTYACP